jgi:hypothetical protein
LTGAGIYCQSRLAATSRIPRATGTYEINADCTGKAQLCFTDGSPTLRLRLVVADRGDQIRTIVEGNATGSFGVRVR